jgi:hypothetical protein
MFFEDKADIMGIDSGYCFVYSSEFEAVGKEA